MRLTLLVAAAVLAAPLAQSPAQAQQQSAPYQLGSYADPLGKAGGVHLPQMV